MTEADLLADVDVDRLPPQARRLARIIGLPGTLRLLRALGGTRQRMPIDASRAQTLANVLTADELAALARSTLAGERLELPTFGKVCAQVRAAAVRADRQTLSVDTVARKWGLSRRRVIGITGEVADAPEAPAASDDLFA